LSGECGVDIESNLNDEETATGESDLEKSEQEQRTKCHGFAFKESQAPQEELPR